MLNLCDFLECAAQSYATAAAKQLAVPIVATGVVIDPIPVTDIEAVLGAVPPDCALHEPRKCHREGRIELPSIDIRGEEPENAGAPSRLIAPVAVRMIGAEALQDPGPVEEIVDQGVDSDKCRADFDQQRPSVTGAQQQR